MAILEIMKPQHPLHLLRSFESLIQGIKFLLSNKAAAMIYIYTFSKIYLPFITSFKRQGF